MSLQVGGGCNATPPQMSQPGACLPCKVSFFFLLTASDLGCDKPSTFSSSRTIQIAVMSQASLTAVFGCLVLEQRMLIQISELHLDLPLIPDMLKGENKFILAKQEVKFLMMIVREEITKEKIKQES